MGIGFQHAAGCSHQVKSLPCPFSTFEKMVVNFWFLLCPSSFPGTSRFSHLCVKRQHVDSPPASESVWPHTGFPFFRPPSVPHHAHRGTNRLESNLAALIWKVVSPCSTQCRFRLHDAKWLWVCKSVNKHHFCIYMFFSLQKECFHTHYLSLKENKYYFSIGLLLVLALAFIQILFFLF